MPAATKFRNGTIDVAQKGGYAVEHVAPNIDKIVKGRGKTLVEIEATYSKLDFVSSAWMTVGGKSAGAITHDMDKKMIRLRTWLGAEGVDLTRTLDEGVIAAQAGVDAALVKPTAEPTAKPAAKARGKKATPAKARGRKAPAPVVLVDEHPFADPEGDEIIAAPDHGSVPGDGGFEVKLVARVIGFIESEGTEELGTLISTFKAAPDGSVVVAVDDALLHEIESIAMAIAESTPSTADERALKASGRALCKQLNV